MAFIDPNLIQKFLTISGDVIKKQLLNTPGIGNKVNDKRKKSNIIVLDAVAPNQIPPVISRDLEPADAMLTISRQHELMNPTCLPSISSSVEVFASEQAYLFPFTNFSREKIDKPVDHRFTFDISFLIPFDKKLYKFSANSSNVKNKKYFLFTDFSLTNTAKDIYTARSTYQIELKITFTDLNLLLEETIEAVNINDPNDKKNFAVINLIYRFASAAPVPAIGAGAAASSARDNDGVYVLLELNLKENYERYYQSLIQDLNPTWTPKSNFPLLSRTLHCTYHKHEIVMGGNLSKEELQAGVSLPNSNTLTINLVSYETDSGRKDFVSPTTVSQPDNLYDLLENPSVDTFNNNLKTQLRDNAEMDTLGVSDRGGRSSGFGTIKNIKKLLEEINVLNNIIQQNQSFLSCLSIYSDAKKLGRAKPEDFPQFERRIGLFGAGEITVSETSERVKKEIESLKNEINLIKFSINKSLAWYLLSFCNTYKLTIPYEALQTFDDTQFIKSFSKNFSGKEFLTATGTGAAFGAGGGLVGSGISAASSATFYAVGVAIKSAFEKEIISKNLDFLAVRNTVQNFGTISNAQTFSEKLKEDLKSVRAVYGDVSGTKAMIKGGIGGKAISEDEFLKKEAERAKKIINGEEDSFTSEEKKIAAAYAAVGLASDTDPDQTAATLGVANDKVKPSTAANIEIQKTGVTGNVDIQFILFGELLNILTNDNTFILLGGKPFPKEEIINPIPLAAGSKIISEYLDFYHFPINLQKFNNFLYENILKRPEPYYNTEVFIKDIFEQLIRQPLMDGQKNIDESFSKLAPTYLVATTTTHYDATALQYFVGKDASGNKKIDFINLLVDDEFFEFKKNFTKSKFLPPPPPPSFVGPPAPITKIITFFSDEQIKFHDFYKSYEDDARFGVNSTLFWNEIGSRKTTGKREPDFSGIYDNQKFEEFINQRYFMPCIAPRTVSSPTVLIKSKSVTFSRIDNPNLTTGNIIDNQSFLRLPYNFSVDLFPHLVFFLDVGNHIFIQPPSKNSFNDITTEANNSFNLKSQFGLTGLYVINKSSFSYKWPLKKGETDPLPTEFSRDENKHSISGILVSYGDSFTTLNQTTGSTVAECKDPTILGLRAPRP